MPLYRYKALNPRGEVLEGQMEAASDADVAARLQEQGHLPMEARLASEVRGGTSWRSMLRPQALGGDRLVQFTQQLATLLGAGHPQVAAALPGMGAVAAGLIAATGMKLVPTLRRHPLGLRVCLAFVALVFCTIALLRWPLLAVLVLFGGVSCVWTWRKIAP